MHYLKNAKKQKKWYSEKFMQRKNTHAIATIICCFTMGAVFVIMALQPKHEKAGLTFDRTGFIAYGYHGETDHCAGGTADGLVDPFEGCDDNNSTNGDGCSSVCLVETGFTCSGTPSTCSATCGDGMKKGGEGCDDGNVENSDGCSSTCTVETGWSCTSASPDVCG